MDNQERLNIGNRISKITILINVILTLTKVIIGILAASSAMVADGIHSLSDVLSTIFVMIGLKIANKDEDKNHPYGHERFEPVAAKLLAIILFVTAIFIGYKAINLIRQGNLKPPSSLAIYAALISIIVKEWMYHYTKKGANKIESSILLADAWHHRTDAFSSIGALIGIIGAIMGYPILDAIAAIIIGIFIVIVSVQIYWQAIKQLVDYSADPEIIATIKSDILNVEGVLCIDVLRTRIHANKLFVDVELSVDKNLSFPAAHDIAEKVHDTIEASQKNVKHCMVHVNPK